MKKYLFKVAGLESGVSLLQFLKTKTGFSGKEVKRAIDAKRCLINSSIERFSTYRVQKGDFIEFTGTPKEELVSLYQDDYLSAWYKPAFYLVSNKYFFLHRLDKETSGVLLNSKEESFLDLFRNREIEKSYFAICYGEVKDRSGVITTPIEKEGVVKDAETAWRTIAHKNGLNLVVCKPKTGRTHQIRIHLASIGLPVLGDHVYGKPGRLAVQRIFLHAYQVAFTHPMTGKDQVIKASIPKEFLEFFDAHLFR